MIYIYAKYSCDCVNMGKESIQMQSLFAKHREVSTFSDVISDQQLTDHIHVHVHDVVRGSPSSVLLLC